jgi:hypothetical protein
VKKHKADTSEADVLKDYFRGQNQHGQEREEFYEVDLLSVVNKKMQSDRFGFWKEP